MSPLGDNSLSKTPFRCVSRRVATLRGAGDLSRRREALDDDVLVVAVGEHVPTAIGIVADDAPLGIEIRVRRYAGGMCLRYGD
jgi:hypothetical protein